MIPQIILSLDQSTKATGWALFEDGQLKESGVKKISSGDWIDRIVVIRKWLVNIFETYPDIHLIIEDVLHSQNGNVFQKLSHLQGVILELAREYHIKTTVVHPQTWKSTLNITNRGRKKEKELSKAFVLEHYQIEAAEDEADAICIGYHFIYSNKNNWS